MTKSNGVDAKGRYQYHYDSKMTEEQRAAAEKKLDDMRESGKITITDDGYGLSQTFMEKILKEQIEAGNIVDKNDDGEEDIFTNMNKRNLGAAFEKIHKTKGYSTNFTNMKKGTSFEYTYEDLENFWESAGYTRKSKTKEKPATQKETKTPDNKQEQVVENNPEAPTQKTVEEQKNNKLDTVILDSITWTNENGKIAEDTYVNINGKPYHFTTGLDTFGTVDPETVDISKLSNKELKEFGSAPSGKKIATEPDVLPNLTTNDRALTPTEEINVSETPVTETPVAKATAKETPVAETPVAKATTKETPVAETPKKSNIKQLDVPAGSLTKTQTEFSTASDKLKNIPIPQPSPKETNTQPTATATPKSNTSNAKTEFENMVNSDPQLANKTDKERAEILKTKASNIETEISRLQRPTVVYKKRLFGGSKPKVIATAEQNTEKNKEQIAKLEQELDTAKRNSTYANAIAGNITGFGATSLVDKNGNTVANYPQYTTVKYRDANGQESNVARVITYNITTKKNDINYYPFDVQKVNDLKGQPERWQAVPDMKNQLTDGQEIR